MCCLLAGEDCSPFVALPFSLFFVLVSGGRGILVAWCAVFLAALCIGRTHYAQMALWQLGALATGMALNYWLVVSVVFPTSAERIITRYALERVTDASSGRYELWQAAWELIKENPFFGVGPQHYLYEIDKTATPHNLLLTIGSEWGVLALICLSAVIAYVLIRWTWRLAVHRDESHETYIKQIGLFSALAGALAYSMFSSVQITPFSQTVLFIVIGLALGQCLPKKPVKSTPRMNGALFLSVVIAGCYFFGFTYQEFFEPDAVLVLEGQTNDPRIWTNGRMGDYSEI